MRSILLILCVLIFISEISSEPYIATILGLGQASSINNKGQVAGTSSGNAFLWQSGNMTYLGILGGANSYATAIDNNGYVVGSADTSSGARSAFLWRSQQEGMVNLGGFSATGINDNGYVVGYSKARCMHFYGKMDNLCKILVLFLAMTTAQHMESISMGK